MIVKEIDLGIIDVTGVSRVRLGRVTEDNDHILPHPAVSAHHAVLEKTDDSLWLIRD
mgnify:CR=1 FL=1